MPFDSQGTFTRIHNWEDDRINNIEIITDNHDEEDDNFAQGLNETFLRNGAVPMQGDLNVGNYQIKALANGVNDTDGVNKSQLDAVIETVDETLADFETSMADTLATAVQFNMITNCIVSAPNGVVECDENTATVQAGLQVLIPYGIDEDGYLNNVSYTVENAVDITMINYSNAYIFVRSDEACFVASYLGAFASAPTPNSVNNFYYNYTENYMYTTSDVINWTKTPSVIVARISGTGSAITSCVCEGIARVLISKDKESITHWGMPDYSAGISRSSGVTYHADQDGYLLWQGYINEGYTEYQLKIDGIVVGQGNNNNWAHNFARCIFPIGRNSSYYSSGHSHFTYFPVKGA